ncbi:MAG TPA: ATP synthase subunit I [Bryobacteraceae bacterium]|nr:ATP synthase subunit I [Bryobacteraceae bacterium]
MSAGLEQRQLDAAIARLPRWILGLAVVGTLAAGGLFGVRTAAGFLLGSLAAWVNLWLIVRAVDRIGHLAVTGNARGLKPRRKGFLMFIQFTALILVAFAILYFSGFRVIAVLCGFLVCPAAVILEIVYELVIYEHS